MRYQPVEESGIDVAAADHRHGGAGGAGLAREQRGGGDRAGGLGAELPPRGGDSGPRRRSRLRRPGSPRRTIRRRMAKGEAADAPRKQAVGQALGMLEGARARRPRARRRAWRRRRARPPTTSHLRARALGPPTQMPASRPPPPTGTRIVSTSGRCSRISRPTVPCPAMTSGWSNGGIMTSPSLGRDRLGPLELLAPSGSGRRR